MPPRLSLKAFLSSARAALAAPPRSTPLTFVIGNESADLDSLCSAILCAYLRSHTPPHALHIPLANLPRADLPLRTEMTAVLAHAGLTPSDLLTLSDLPDRFAPHNNNNNSNNPDSRPRPSEDADAGPEPRWFLVDHNALTGALRRFQPNVVGVIDHHVDEHATPASAAPRIVEPCGSCASLVIAEYASTWERLSSAHEPLDGPQTEPEAGQGVDARAEDERLASLGLAPILVDTINLTDASKTTAKDVAALEFLRGKTGGSALQTTAFYEDITAVKDDISALGLRDILRKDYKEWEEHGLRLGISAVVQNFDYLLAREATAAGGEGAFLAAVEAWAAERGLDLASVMTVSSAGNPGDEFQRHLLVWGVTDGGSRAVRRFAHRVGAPLGLETWRQGMLDAEGRRVWRQMELTASRKQVAPLLREALKEEL
ncbi:Exopolyphosphatase [Escovopsis weberi]|uniref:Exopolyphosphatase n=1 Tax=Escovopsis weberi TaxID=150374 RepID=A0A0M9VVF7_ESCWE|nr:Exopolyphosphatase [Escovopsis weberi]